VHGHGARKLGRRRSRPPPRARHHGHKIVHVHESIAAPVDLPHHLPAVVQAVALPELAQDGHDLLRADPVVPVPVEHKCPLCNISKFLCIVFNKYMISIQQFGKRSITK
jgi:hypothetical protein